jgi:hypothetical protein
VGRRGSESDFPTAKALVWPYFVFFADRGESASNDGEKITEYTDKQCNVAFQCLANWKLQKPPAPGEARKLSSEMRQSVSDICESPS